MTRREVVCFNDEKLIQNCWRVCYSPTLKEIRRAPTLSLQLHLYYMWKHCVLVPGAQSSGYRNPIYNLKSCTLCKPIKNSPPWIKILCLNNLQLPKLLSPFFLSCLRMFCHLSYGFTGGVTEFTPLEQCLCCVLCLSMLPADQVLLQKIVTHVQKLLDMKKTSLSSQCKNKNGLMN